MKEHPDLSFICFTLLCILLASFQSCEYLGRIDKKLDQLIEQGKPTEKSK